MTNAIAELRDLNLELESLKARKNAIKTKLAEHRDSFTDEDITNSTTEANEIRTQIESVKEKIKDAQERAKIEEEKRGFFPEENLLVPGRYEIEIPGKVQTELSFICSLEENIEEIFHSEIYDFMISMGYVLVVRTRLNSIYRIK